MDFLDPAKKKGRTRRLLATYIFLAFAIAAGTLLLGLASFGYHFNRATGEITRSGLLFVSAQPESAEIYLNGDLNPARTNTRLELPEGDYHVELKHDGYRPWQRNIQLAGGTIERLVYTVLFPVNLVMEDVQLYGKQPGLATQSPDRRWLIVSQPGSLSEFDVFDLNNEATPSTVISLPSNLLTASDQLHRLEAVEWSTDNRHVLLKHSYGNQQEFIMLDREEPGQSLNINALFGINPSQVALRDKRFDQLYIYDKASKTLRTANVRTRALVPLLDRVLAFKAHDDDRLLYVTDESAGPGKVNVKITDGDSASYTIKRLNATDRYLLDMARFDGKWYVAVGSGAESKAYIYEDPLEQLAAPGFAPLLPEAVLSVQGATKLSFSANARFLAVQGGQHFAVYDFETSRRHLYQLEAPLAAGQTATWMDGHRLTARSESKTLVFDYDGINQQGLAPISAFQPFFDRDYTALYTIAPSKDIPTRSALLRTELEIP